MYVHQDSGLVNISYFKFDVDDTTGKWIDLLFFFLVKQLFKQSF